MSFGPSPPPPPDPYAVAAAQQKANIGVAVANTWLANADEDSPTGTLTYTQIGTYTWEEPIYSNAGGGQGTGAGNIVGFASYSIPIFKRTIAYKPAEAEIFEADQVARSRLANLAKDQAARISTALGTILSTDGLPPVATTPASPVLNGTVPDAGLVIDTIGASDFGVAKEAVASAIKSRLDFQRNLDRETLITRLANQGIFAGSEAWNNTMRLFEFRSADDEAQAILAAGQEQTRLFALEKERAVFYNAAQGQRFDQGRLVIEIANRVAIQAFTVALQIADFVNTTRERAFQELLTVRNSSLNELSTLMRGTVLPLPQFAQFKAATIQAADLQGAVYASAQLDQQNFKSQVALQSAIIGGIGAIAGGALGGPIGSKLLGQLGQPTTT